MFSTFSDTKQTKNINIALVWFKHIASIINVQILLSTHSQTTNLDSSKPKEFADDNFKFHDNGRKFSKRVENTVGKGETARSEQFLLFPQCFQKACFPGCQKVLLCGNGLIYK